MNNNFFNNNHHFVLYILTLFAVLVVALVSIGCHYQFNFEFRQDETEIHLGLSPSKEEIDCLDEVLTNTD